MFFTEWLGHRSELLRLSVTPTVKCSLPACENVEIRHRDTAEHRADDAEKTLVGARDVEVVDRGAAIADFLR
jgi:hypothetical protein